MTLGTNIKKLREKAKQSQLDLAIECKLNPAWLNRVENDKAGDVRLSTILKVAKGLGVPATKLVENVEYKEKRR